MRRRVGSARAANVRSNAFEGYLTIWLTISEEIPNCKFFFGFSKQAVNCARSRGNRPGRNRQERAEDKRFDREFPMIFLGEKISREVSDRATLRFSRDDCSLNFDYAHDST